MNIFYEILNRLPDLAIRIKNFLAYLIDLDVRTVDVGSGEIEEFVESPQNDSAFVIVRNVKLDTRTGQAFVSSKSRKDVLISESSLWTPAEASLSRTFKQIKIKEVVQDLVTPGPSSNNYFHFLIDELPKYLKIRDLKLPTRVIYSRQLPNIQIEVLVKLGFELVRSHSWVNCEKLLLPRHSIKTGKFQFSEILLLRHSFLENFGDCNKFIYISRLKSRRIFDQEHKLIDWLKSNTNFEILYLEELTFTEQIHNFATAKVIVAPHGAGLANLIWCAPNTFVYELLDENVIYNVIYAELAKVCSLNYQKGTTFEDLVNFITNHRLLSKNF